MSKVSVSERRTKRRKEKYTILLIGALLLLALIPFTCTTLQTRAESEVIAITFVSSTEDELLPEDPYSKGSVPEDGLINLSAFSSVDKTFNDTESVELILHPVPIYTEEEVMMLARCIYYEAWCDCTDRHRELVAQVVLNRVASDYFPDTIYEVLAQPGQYANDYYSGVNEVPDFALEKCRELAIKALEGNVECPPNVLFQSNYAGLGDGTWMEFDTFYSTTYFNYVD